MRISDWSSDVCSSDLRMVDNPSKLTLEGQPLGTPEYMSPELARGDVAECTSDVWSLTVLLYELLTRRCPFEAPKIGRASCRESVCQDVEISVVAVSIKQQLVISD